MSLLNASTSRSRTEPEYTAASGGKLLVQNNVVDNRDSMLPFNQETRNRRNSVLSNKKAHRGKKPKLKLKKNQRQVVMLDTRDMSLDLIVEEIPSDPREEKKEEQHLSSSSDDSSSSSSRESSSSSSDSESFPTIQNNTHRSASLLHGNPE